MDNFKQFWLQYKGIIIGAVVAMIILFTKLYSIIIALILIAVCMYVGYYIQNNKYEVKEKLKKFIDKL